MTLHALTSTSSNSHLQSSYQLPGISVTKTECVCVGGGGAYQNNQMLARCDDLRESWLKKCCALGYSCDHTNVKAEVN